MRKTLYVIVLSVSFFLTACSSKKEEAPAAKVEDHDPDIVEFTDEQYKTVGIELGAVVIINLSNYIKASGTIDVPP
jgi:cobalt-zinc-cadmium efflux system membrane fusion protein